MPGVTVSGVPRRTLLSNLSDGKENGASAQIGASKIFTQNVKSETNPSDDSQGQILFLRYVILGSPVKQL